MNQPNPFAFAAGERPEGAHVHRPPSIAAIEDGRLRLLGAYAALTSHAPAELPKSARLPVQRLVCAISHHVRDLDQVLIELRRGES